ncbi:hypothetical protein ETR_09166 [Erwinia tracheiphila PSU-1]|nr:hypothetical protein ETR_09166 [Erwinia tracheiphila PSU-1]
MDKPGAEQRVHSDWKATQIKVNEVLFAQVLDQRTSSGGTENHARVG